MAWPISADSNMARASLTARRERYPNARQPTKSQCHYAGYNAAPFAEPTHVRQFHGPARLGRAGSAPFPAVWRRLLLPRQRPGGDPRSEEHTSELQSRENLVCRLLLEKKKTEQGSTQPHR